MTTAQGDDDRSTTSPEFHKKSCDRCGLKKRKCDGGHPCRRCIRTGDTCSYSTRRTREKKLQRPWPFSSVDSASDRSIQVPSTLQARRGVSTALQQYGRVSLKRCRLSPSPATGLVGMQENAFLSDYFGCVGFLPLTSQSNIREAMVNIFAGSVSVQQSNSGDYSTREQHFDKIIPADSQLPVDPSTCVFWCAVALGSLVKGRPIESVEKYCRLAREALANFSGPPNAEVGRAWAIMAYLSDFCGDHENFHVYVKRANAILSEVQEEGSEPLPVGLSDVVKHGETIRIFVGDVNKEEVESFCNQERANPQINQAATEGEICKFVMQSYRAFEQALYLNVVEHRPRVRRPGLDGEPAADTLPADPTAADFLKGSKPHFFASLMREQDVALGSSGILDMMVSMLKEQSRDFQRVELAAGRPNIREGIGGLIINGTLVFERICKKDIGGALENLENCGEVFQRYPGLCRFTMGAHVTHMLLANLFAIDGPRARVVYDKMRTAYNSVLLAGTPPIPPFEEWQGVSSCCDNYYCRLMEFMVSLELDGTSSSSPPQERAAEMQEKGPRDAPAHGGQQRGVPFATDSRGGAVGNSPVVSRPTHKAIDASRSKREPGQGFDEESVGGMENTSDAWRAATTQPREPTPTTPSLFGEVGSEPMVMVDSDVGRHVNEQTNSSRMAGLGAQAAEAVFCSEFSKGRTVAGETEYDAGIGVEDWLDVTHAMLDTSISGLDLE